MFGYVNVFKDELKIKEYTVFKAYYCALCREQGRLLGAVTRLGLSYDFAVLSLLLDSLYEEQTAFKVCRCSVNPLIKRQVVEANSKIAYCAYMSVALTYYKIKDDIADSLISPAIIALPFYALPMNEVVKKYPQKLKVVEACLKDLAALEREGCTCVDRVADTSGRLMSELFAFPEIEQDSTQKVLRELGYNIGRWIYIIDAIDDFEKDKKRGSYNPFENEKQIQDSEAALWYNLHSVSTAYELLPINKHKAILDNIIYMGLKNTTERILYKKSCNSRGQE